MKEAKATATTIRSINRESASEQVYQQMRNLIDTQVWEPGSKIPSENMLSEQFGVSRMTIRSATQKLKALGLLDIRSGSGSYVEYPSLSAYIGKDADSLPPNALRDVYALRYYLEQAAVEFAVKNASQENINELRQILTRLEDAAVNYKESFRKYDMDFHRYIYKMSGNQLLLTMFTLVEPLLLSQMDKFDSKLPTKELEDGRLLFHRRLFESIESRDIKRCMQQLYWYRDVSESDQANITVENIKGV